MKILHLTPDLNFLEKFVRPLAEYQWNNGLKVEISSCCGVYKDLTPENLNTSDVSKLYFHELCLKPAGARWIFSLIKLVSLIRTSKPDVVVLHTTTLATAPMIILTLFFPRVMRIYFNHGVPCLGYKGILGAILRVIEWVNLSLSHCTYTISKSMQKTLLKISNKSNVELVGSGSACGVTLRYSKFYEVEMARKKARDFFRLSSKDKVLLFVGRPTARKGLWDLISAWKKINKNQAIKLFLVGPTQKDLDSRGIDSSADLSVFGYCSDPSIFFLACDMLCVPSYHEGLGYTYLEAATFGCIPMCSDIPGPTDFVRDNETGVTVEPGNVESIIQRIVNLFANPELMRSISIQAFEEVKVFHRDTVTHNIAESISNKLDEFTHFRL